MIKITIAKSVQLDSDYSAFVQFRYNETIVDVIKSLPFRYYDTEYKDWEIPIDKIKWLQEQIDTNFEIEDPADVLHKPQEKIEIPEGLFKTTPYEHQIEGVEYGLKKRNWFLGDEQGLGKTKTIIDLAIARKIKFGYKHCLIICGVNTLKWNWVEEIKTHSNESVWILGQKRLKNGKLRIGSTKDKINDLNWLLENETNTYFLVTNIESFRDKEFADTVKKLCDKKIINMCAADEIHKMKNPTSQQSKGFFKCIPECKIAMTGTPVMNNPLDVYIILKWLGYETHAYGAFRNHYCIMGGFGGRDVVGYRNMQELQNKLHEIMLRRLKDEVFDLPEKVYVDELIEMTPNQTKIYKEADSYIREHIDLIASEPNPLSSLIRLRQATGYTGILSSTIHESAKLDRMEDIVEEAVSNGRKIVIFSNWTQMTDEIFKRLWDNFDVLQITGETPDNVRQQSVNEFQKGICNVLVGTIGAMGTGLTLTAGTVVIFVDHPWTRATFDQAVDRCHRIGQKNSITIYNLMCKDTIDERVFNLMNQKGDIADILIDNKNIMSNKETLNYLLGG